MTTRNTKTGHSQQVMMFAGSANKSKRKSPSVVCDSPITASRVNLHCKTWRDCSACPLHENTPGNRRVFYRGKIPADILFIGEAPGSSEASRGNLIPFVPFAPSGNCLQQIIRLAVPEDYTYCIANSVCCVPYTSAELTHIGEPKASHYEPCSARIEELIDLVQPSYIIALGRIASKQLDYLGWEHLYIMHPSAISSQGDMGAVDLKRAVNKLKDYLS